MEQMVKKKRRGEHKQHLQIDAFAIFQQHTIADFQHVKGEDGSNYVEDNAVLDHWIELWLWSGKMAASSHRLIFSEGERLRELECGYNFYSVSDK